jgi:hypothetical protein
MRATLAVCVAAVICPCFAQLQLQRPGIEAQRAAMKRLDFLVGQWAGDVRLSHERGGLSELVQTEEAQYRSGGLVLEIEGAGLDKYNGEVISRSLGVISYDDEKKSYRFRAWNDGRYVETELKLIQTGKGLAWEYGFGDMRISHTMRINDSGEWIQTGEVITAAESPRKFLDVSLRRRK